MNDWHQTFRRRMRNFEDQNKSSQGSVPVSVKIRVTGGCFHREHSPCAYEIIDRCLGDVPGSEGFTFEEHESGPELLIFVAAATAGISLAKSIIDLIVSIVKARSEGIRKGDHPEAPLELIVRRTQKDGQFTEETVLRVGHRDAIAVDVIEKQLKESLSLLLKKDENANSWRPEAADRP